MPDAGGALVGVKAPADGFLAEVRPGVGIGIAAGEMRRIVRSALIPLSCQTG